MKRVIVPIILAGLLVALGMWWYSPSQILKRRTHTLLSTLTLEEGSGKVGRQMKSYSLNDLLAPEVELDNTTIKQANGSFERAELESAFSWLCGQARQSRFKALDFEAVEIQGGKAQVRLMLSALVELPSYRPADGVFLATFHWEKGKDGWRLTRASWREAE